MPTSMPTDMTPNAVVPDAALSPDKPSELAEAAKADSMGQMGPPMQIEPASHTSIHQPATNVCPDLRHSFNMNKVETYMAQLAKDISRLRAKLEDVPQQVAALSMPNPPPPGPYTLAM